MGIMYRPSPSLHGRQFLSTCCGGLSNLAFSTLQSTDLKTSSNYGPKNDVCRIDGWASFLHLPFFNSFSRLCCPSLPISHSPPPPPITKGHKLMIRSSLHGLAKKVFREFWAMTQPQIDQPAPASLDRSFRPSKKLTPAGPTKTKVQSRKHLSLFPFPATATAKLGG